MKKLLIVGLLLITNNTYSQQSYNKLSVKELDVTTRVNVASTTNSSKPCPAMTEVQRNAIASPLNGSCVYNTTSSKLNVYNGSVWKAAGGGVDNWATSTAYSVDDIVIQSSKIYQCLVAHTSGTFTTDLAASRWVEVSAQTAVNLTGPITSVGNATSIASQTGTGSTFVVQNTPTLTTPNIGAATGTSLILAGNISAYNYDKDNLLVNGNIENPLSSEWTCTVGTCTRTTSSGEFSKDTAALKISLSAQAMNVSQTANTPSGIQKQGFARVIYKVPSTLETFQICTLVDAAEQTCIPSANLILDNTFRTIEIPLIFGSTSAGVKFKTSSDTGDAFIDGVVLAQGIPTQNLALDDVYSAKISVTGVVSGENKDFINGNCVITSTSVFTCSVPSTFTVTPNCQATGNVNDRISVNYILASSTPTSLVFHTVDSNTAGSVAFAFSINCQKSGNDYLASSAAVYSQASANYSRTPYTPTFTGFGTPSNVECYHSRDGEFLEVDCKWVGGTSTAVEARVSLPNSLTTSSAIPSIKVVGKGNTSVAATTYFSGLSVLANASLSYVTMGAEGSANTGLTSHQATVLGNGNTYSIYFRVPISGWSNAGQIVGSFSGYTNVPGYQGLVDTFSVSYGAGTITTVCAASTSCTLYNQIGTAFSSISQAGAGVMTSNFSKTYAKLNCWGNALGANVTIVDPASCSNCNTLSWVARNTVSGGVTSYGTINCQGTY